MTDALRTRLLNGYRTVYREAVSKGDQRTMRAVLKRIEHDASAVEYVTQS